ncbi:MFS transporter [Kribbella sp. NPDC055110]
MTAACLPAAELVPEINPRRLTLVFALTQTVGYGALVQAFPVLLIPMAQDLGVSRTAITGASTISTLIGALAAVPIGHLLDRFGGRLMMTTGSVLGVLAVVLWSTAGNLVSLYLAFVLVGLAVAMSTYEAAFAVLVVAAGADRRDQAILAVTMVTGLATSLYYPLTGWLELELGWRSSLLVLAAVLAAAAVPAHLWGVPARATHRLSLQSRAGTQTGRAVRSIRFWLLALAFVGQSAAVSAFLLQVVAYLRDIGHSPETASTMPTVVGILMIVSRLAVTRLSRRYGMTRLTALSFAIQGIGLLLMPLAGASLPLIILSVAAVGLGQGVGVIARPSIVADAFGALRFASIVAVMTVPMALSRAAAPLVASWLPQGRFLILGGATSLVAAAALATVLRLPPLNEVLHFDGSSPPGNR